MLLCHLNWQFGSGSSVHNQRIERHNRVAIHRFHHRKWSHRFLHPLASYKTCWMKLKQGVKIYILINQKYTSRFVLPYSIRLSLESDWSNAPHNVISTAEHMATLWNEIAIFPRFGKTGSSKPTPYVKLREFCDVFKIACKEFSFAKNKHLSVRQFK